jgi:c-di-GMP-binding flagellar brake protein YcgR
MPIKSINRDKKIQIIRADNIEKNKLNKEFAAKLVDVVDEKIFIALTQTNDTKGSPFSAGENIKFSFTSEDCCFIADAEVTEMNCEENSVLFSVYLKTGLKRVQRREDFRVKVHLPFSYRRHYLDKCETEIGHINNISAGGIRFTSDKQLVFGERIDIVLDLDQNIKIGATAKILMCDLIGFMKFDVRSQFENLDWKMKEKLNQFIFNVQREQFRLSKKEII